MWALLSKARLVKWAVRLIAAGAAGLGVLVFLLLVMLGGIVGSTNAAQRQAAAACLPGSGAGVVPTGAGLGSGQRHGGGNASGGYDAEQLQDAKTIIAVGQRYGVPAYGWVIAIATAIQESDLHNLPGGDRDSLGLFQQRPSSGWGTPAQIMVPANAAAAFYGRAHYTHNTGLMQVAGWQQMPVTVAAQAVQHSGFPDAYAQHETAARALVQVLASGVTAADLQQSSTPAYCTAGVAGISTSVVSPVAPGSFVDLNNYGRTGSHWASIHTGDDLAAACGTPVVAATAGTIVIESGGGWAWAGKWLVKVQTAPGQLTTWYGHMRKLEVANGQKVTAGQQIGEVGDLGNAVGCHLHFEVHPHGGGYNQDQIDPHPWLLSNVGKTLNGSK